MRTVSIVCLFVGGLAFLYWLLFVGSALALVQHIYWSGTVDGDFELSYLASLYGPPVVIAGCFYLTFRRSREAH